LPPLGLGKSGPLFFLIAGPPGPPEVVFLNVRKKQHPNHTPSTLQKARPKKISPFPLPPYRNKHPKNLKFHSIPSGLGGFPGPPPLRAAPRKGARPPATGLFEPPPARSPRFLKPPPPGFFPPQAPPPLAWVSPCSPRGPPPPPKNGVPPPHPPGRWFFFSPLSGPLVAAPRCRLGFYRPQHLPPLSFAPAPPPYPPVFWVPWLPPHVPNPPLTSPPPLQTIFRPFLDRFGVSRTAVCLAPFVPPPVPGPVPNQRGPAAPPRSPQG